MDEHPVPLDGPSQRDAITGFRVHAQRVFRRFRQYSCNGYLEFSLGGRPHLHGVIFHPGTNTKQLILNLNSEYSGDDAVYVEPWHRDQTIVEALQGTTGYGIRHSQ
jgi:hypothetical protein